MWPNFSDVTRSWRSLQLLNMLLLLRKIPGTKMALRVFRARVVFIVDCMAGTTPTTAHNVV
jgi:hypothetical protein